jgi:hypothetical protein
MVCSIIFVGMILLYFSVMLEMLPSGCSYIYFPEMFSKSCVFIRFKRSTRTFDQKNIPNIFVLPVSFSRGSPLSFCLPSVGEKIQCEELVTK